MKVVGYFKAYACCLPPVLYYVLMRFRGNIRSDRRQGPEVAQLEDCQEVQRYKNLQSQRLARQVDWILDHMLDQTTGFHGIIRIDAKIDEFNFSRMRSPGRHKSGFIREARFIDGNVWLQATTANALSNSLHNLLLYKGERPHEYSLTPINQDCQAVGHSVEAIGSAAIADKAPNILLDLGKIQSVFEIERDQGWPHALAATDLNRAKIPVATSQQ